MADYQFRIGDTLPDPLITDIEPADLDLDNSAATVHWKRRYSDDDWTVNDAEVDPAERVLRYAIQDGDFTDPGLFSVVWRLTLEDARIASIPNRGALTLRVSPDITEEGS